jgi:hypothetical protein
MKLFIFIALLGLASCAAKPVIAKDCVKAEGSNLYVCKKF